MENISEIRSELKKLIEEAYNVSKDTGAIIEESLKDAITNPFSKEEVERLLTTIIDRLKKGAQSRGDVQTADAFDKNMNVLISKALDARKKIIKEASPETGSEKVLPLLPFDDLKPGPLQPKPTFNGKKIPMNCGGVKTTDIKLWENNERLDIHVNQFRATNGRSPSSQELLDIMLSKMPLQGLAGDDQFEIEDLARSIGNNGVRKAPIIARDGTLLDGNRRVAACYYILNSKDFNAEQKKRAETIFVWQLTEHATENDKDTIVVSLNFERSTKVDWPDYVRAKIIYAEWQAMLAMEPDNPGPSRLAQMRRDLSRHFGYGNNANVIIRYIKMIEWANDFEDHLVNEKGKNEFEVKHQANHYFQYFEELSKGSTPGGVAYTLNQDEPFKHLVFDLLFQNKFKNWTLLRSLKHYNEDVLESLIKAKDMTDLESAQELVEDKLNEAKAQKRESRVGNPNQRIEVFTEWLEALPISAFRDSIHPENLKKLRAALELVNKQISDLNI